MFLIKYLRDVLKLLQQTVLHNNKRDKVFKVVLSELIWHFDSFFRLSNNHPTLMKTLPWQLARISYSRKCYFGTTFFSHIIAYSDNYEGLSLEVTETMEMNCNLIFPNYKWVFEFTFSGVERTNKRVVNTLILGRRFSKVKMYGEFSCRNWEAKCPELNPIKISECSSCAFTQILLIVFWANVITHWRHPFSIITVNFHREGISPIRIILIRFYTFSLNSPEIGKLCQT